MISRFQNALCILSLLISISSFSQKPGEYKILTDKVIVYPDVKLSGGAKAVQVQVMNDNIIRVTASPEKDIYPSKGLSVILIPQSSSSRITKEKDHIEIISSSFKTIIDPLTGNVSFTDLNGNDLIKEKKVTGRKISPAVYEGTPLYSLSQDFELTNEDAVYGLGQHQDDVWNYRNKQVLFFQNNTEIAIPFLVSIKNYGILWDNYSMTKAGDVRTYQPLTSLLLFDENKNQGWLTATYVNNKNKPEDILFKKAESVINYPFLNDTKQRLPKEFDPAKGKITWEGAVESLSEGVHHFKFTYAGYFKLWWNGELKFDKWRQSWNPGTALLEPMVKKGEKYPIKIEWMPDGGESYISAGFLPPIADENKNDFSFSSEAGHQVDYYFVHGKNIDDVIAGYRELTGKAPIAPKWAFGFWQSRERYRSQNDILKTVDEFRKRKVPLDNIVQDWFYWKENQWGSQEFDASRFSNPDSMIDMLHKKYNAQFMISVWPKFYEGINSYNEFNKRGWLYTRNIADRQKDWVGPGYVSTFYDVFNDDARNEFWKLLHDKIFVKGIDAW